MLSEEVIPHCHIRLKIVQPPHIEVCEGVRELRVGVDPNLNDVRDNLALFSNFGKATFDGLVGIAHDVLKGRKVYPQKLVLYIFCLLIWLVRPVIFMIGIMQDFHYNMYNIKNSPILALRDDSENVLEICGKIKRHSFCVGLLANLLTHVANYQGASFPALTATGTFSYYVHAALYSGILNCKGYGIQNVALKLNQKVSFAKDDF